MQRWVAQQGLRILRAIVPLSACDSSPADSGCVIVIGEYMVELESSARQSTAPPQSEVDPLESFQEEIKWITSMNIYNLDIGGFALIRVLLRGKREIWW